MLFIPTCLFSGYILFFETPFITKPMCIFELVGSPSIIFRPKVTPVWGCFGGQEAYPASFRPNGLFLWQQWQWLWREAAAMGWKLWPLFRKSNPTLRHSSQQGQGLPAHLKMPPSSPNGFSGSQHQGCTGWLWHILAINTQSLYQTALGFVLWPCRQVQRQDDHFCWLKGCFIILFVGCYFYCLTRWLLFQLIVLLPPVLLKEESSHGACIIPVKKGVSSCTWIRSWTWPQQMSHPFSQEQILLQFTGLQGKNCAQKQTTVCTHGHIWLFIDMHILLYVHMYIYIYIL